MDQNDKLGFMMGRVLVTGATGYIGTDLLNSLAAADLEINILVRHPEKIPHFLRHSEDVRLFKGDLDNFETLRSASRRVDVIFHLAASLRLWKSCKNLHRTNVIGTQNLLRACKASRSPMRIVFASSIEAVGPSSKPLVTSEDHPKPACYYGVTKLIGERMIMDFCRESRDCTYTIGRIGNVYGHGRGNVVAIRNVLKEDSARTRILEHTLRDYTLNLIHVEDVTEMLRAAAFNGGCENKTYFFVHEAISIGEIVRTLKERYNIATTPKRFPLDRTVLALWTTISRGFRTHDILTYVALGGSTRRFRNYDYADTVADLGYSPRISFRQRRPLDI